MKADAIITMRTEFHPDPLGSGSGYTTETPVEWKGGPIAQLSWYELRKTHRDLPAVGDYLCLGSWLLEVVGVNGWDTPYPCVFVTRSGWAWWYALRFRVTKHWPLFKNRIIATCAVWGMGRYDWGAAPSWSEIYAVAWLQKKLRPKGK